MSNKINPRLLAVKALCRVDSEGSYSNITLNALFSEYTLSNEDKALCSKIFYTTLDRKITIDYILSKFINKGFNKIKPFTLNVLRSAVCQIRFMDKIPDSAAVNEAVKLIKGSKESFNSGFVNGVLRNIIRSETILPEGNDEKSLSVRFSCPEEIVSSLKDDYGAEITEKFLANSLLPPPTYIRVNTHRTDPDALISAFSKVCIKAEKTSLEDCLSISGYSAIDELSEFKNGLFFVQDIACQMAVSMLSVKKGDRVLDLCSAPGGKAFSAYLSAPDIEIIATDLYPKRVNLIKDGAKRLGFSNINSMVHDATKFTDTLGTFDKIICDVPCSGLGVLRRKPEIKYKKQDDFSELSKIQRSILENADKYLNCGGFLLYSTCTLRKAENEDIVRAFLEEHNNYSLVCDKTFMPYIDGSDGFYAAILKKN